MAKHRLAKVVMFLVLELGAMAGVPMRPDQIEELNRILNRPAVVSVQRRDRDGDPPGKAGAVR